MPTRLDILGAGGHASVIVGIAERAGIVAVTVWHDLRRPNTFRFPDFVRVEQVDRLDPSTPVVLGMGDLDSRQEWRRRYQGIGQALVDRSAVIAYGVTIRGGTVVMPAVVVNPNAVIGQDVILNTAAIIEHDCRVEDNVHISPGVRLGGGVTIGAHVLVGTGAVVLPGVSVGARSVIGAGAVVIGPVGAGTTVMGVPARER